MAINISILSPSPQDIIAHLQKLGDPEIAAHSLRYFKTGFGEYGYDDIFLGIRVPMLRNNVKLFQNTPLGHIKKIIKSEFHEIRLFALLLLVHQFSKADNEKKRKNLSAILEAYQIYQ